MKTPKNIFIAFIPALILSACGPARFDANPVAAPSSAVSKTLELTEEQTQAWGASDLAMDTIAGMSVDKAYAELLSQRKGSAVIVGVIDSGVDIEHEDLKNVIWVNEDEIPGNGIDDDRNGYVDDIHGWNFLGNIVKENLEYVRIIRELGPEFEGKEAGDIAPERASDYALFNKAKAAYEKDYADAAQNKMRYQGMYDQLTIAHALVTEKLGTDEYGKEDLAGLTDLTQEEQGLVERLGQMMAFGPTIPAVLNRLNGGVEYFTNRLESHFNLSTDYRAADLGDDANDWSSKYYGNNDVDGPDPKKEDARHGTHVAGIIAAERNNGIGMNGVADYAKIMVVRAVPDGDEYDKDVALAIRYCVNNGAKVLNTSFGKGFSPHPEWVWDAIRYASDNDVLIVNAAGNDGMDLDQNEVYPNDVRPGETEEIGNTFITIGASTPEFNEGLVAGFSNYGEENVDVFSPGTQIWSTTPLNTYEYLQGTSMAAPAVAGVAAVIRSYFPKLSAAQVKQILMDSGLAGPGEVILGGDPNTKNNFANISKSGHLVNLYNALIMADQMSR
jgi:subtilisin family serine protease